MLVLLWETEGVHVVAKTLWKESRTDLKYEASPCEHSFEFNICGSVHHAL